MRRALLAASLLVAAVALAPEPAPVAGGALAGFARSLGGIRVGVVDAVFLQAEAARRAGRREDAADLYELVLRLDPDDEAAGAFVAEARYDVVRQIPDVATRRDAFLALLDELQAAWALRARRARLKEVAARLVLMTRVVDAPLYAALASRWKQPLLVALRWLADAARETGRLPATALDRLHLRQFPYLVIEVAAAAEARGDVAVRDEALALGHEVLDLRRELLASLMDVPTGETADPQGGRLPLDEVLELGLVCVERVAAGAADAAARVAEFAEQTGPSAARAALEDALEAAGPGAPPR